ncbi:SdpI family protein [Eubacteriales bacterium OttesenSCG-928-N13]|nr:SdpI family protein [Eubacteriales bacterium OttesenSCG-928-N13]
MKHRWIWWTVLVLNFAVFAVCIMRLPDVQVPIHYNFRGEVDGYGSKWVYLAIASLSVVIMGGYELYRHLTRNNERVTTNRRYEDICVSLIAVLFGVICWMLFPGAGQSMSPTIGSWIGIILGVLMVVLSNIMGKVQPNRTFGYKIPWTLKDDDVWRATHRLAGYCGVVGGFLMIAGGLIGFWYGWGWQLGGMLIGLIVMTVPPAIFAYRMYHRIHG